MWCLRQKGFAIETRRVGRGLGCSEYRIVTDRNGSECPARKPRPPQTRRELSVRYAQSRQAQALVAALAEAGGGWVPVPELHRRVSGRNISTLATLARGAGHKVENYLLRKGGVNLSWYRLA